MVSMEGVKYPTLVHLHVIDHAGENTVTTSHGTHPHIVRGGDKSHARFSIDIYIRSDGSTAGA
jgi:hypothetical protein